MARIKYYDSGTSTWKYADMAVQTGAILPPEYQRCEYIEADGSGQYIDTGLTLNDFTAEIGRAHV